MACAAGVIYFMRGHEVAAFLLILTAAVLLVGASLTNALNGLMAHLSRGVPTELP